MPTDAGYRHYVDVIIREQRDQPQPVALADHERAKAELDEALRETADALSRVTAMLAVVSTPSFSSTTIRHI